MSKKQLSEKGLVAGVTHHTENADEMDKGTGHELCFRHSDVEAVLTKFPFLKSEIEDVFCSVDLGSEWLTSHIPALGGLTPIEVIQKGDLKLVLMTLNKIRYGEYS